MLVSEIFYSIQGEGELTGVPSVFIRTSGCNLRCQWCDTPYASWNPEGKKRTVEEIFREVSTLPAKHAVLTGGEPMLAPDLPDLAQCLTDLGWHITIETAATLPPRGISCHLASLSPKLSNSVPQHDPTWRTKHEALRLQPDVIRQWMDHCPWQLKFVVSTDEDLAEIEALIESIDRPIPPHKILLMPEGRTSEELRQRDAWLVELCKTKGYRYCRRLHIDLFGNKRGT
jgi:7-carboxy-7-deazaguanine synthase